MTDTSTRTVGRSRPKKVRLVVVGAVVLLATLLAVAAYLRVGWSRMESECSLSDAEGQIHGSVSYGWSWQPLGFTCTYDHGQSETSFWF